MFNAAMPEEAKVLLREKLRQRYTWLDQQLSGRNHLTGEDFTVADAYLYVVTRWAPHSRVDLSGLAQVAAFMERVAARPAVQEAQRQSDPR